MAEKHTLNNMFVVSVPWVSSRKKGDALVDAVKANFPGASVTRCERGKVDVDLILGVDSFSLDKALEVRGERYHGVFFFWSPSSRVAPLPGAPASVPCCFSLDRFVDVHPLLPRPNVRSL